MFTRPVSTRYLSYVALQGRFSLFQELQELCAQQKELLAKKCRMELEGSSCLNAHQPARALAAVGGKGQRRPVGRGEASASKLNAFRL